jgi:hypothetical protein
MVPHFLDETMGKPMGHGSRAFVHSVNPIQTQKWTTCILSTTKKIVKKSLEMWLH